MSTDTSCGICQQDIDEEDPDSGAVLVVDARTSTCVWAHGLCAGDGVTEDGNEWPAANLNTHSAGDVVLDETGAFPRYAVCAACNQVIDYDNQPEGDDVAAQFVMPGITRVAGAVTEVAEIVDAHGSCAENYGWKIA